MTGPGTPDVPRLWRLEPRDEIREESRRAAATAAVHAPGHGAGPGRRDRRVADAAEADAAPVLSAAVRRARPARGGFVGAAGRQ